MTTPDLLASKVDLWGMFDALERQYLASRPGVKRAHHAREMLCQAMAYVWGWEDAGRARVAVAYGRDVHADHEFAYMYGIVAIMYDMDMIHSRPSIRDAWRAFQASIDLRDYV